MCICGNMRDSARECSHFAIRRAMVVNRVLLCASLAVLGSGLKLSKKTKHCSKANSNASLLPFDCYVDKGDKYEGLLDSAGTGRKCKNWREEGTHKGMGNNNFCRNPDGSKDKPWCFTLDPKVEWEYCEVPKCPDAGKPPKAWVAPEGAKSKGEPPCKYSPPDDAGYNSWKKGRACEDHKGDKWWLITNKRFKVSDEGGCGKKCQTLPGSEYFTFFGSSDDDGNNCGCYRECVLVGTDLTVNSPNSFRMK